MAVRQTTITRWMGEFAKLRHVRIYLDLLFKVLLENSLAAPRHRGFFFHEHPVAVCIYGIVPILQDVIYNLLRTQRFHWIAAAVLRMRHYLKRRHDLLRLNPESSSVRDASFDDFGVVVCHGSWPRRPPLPRGPPQPATKSADAVTTEMRSPILLGPTKTAMM